MEQLPYDSYDYSHYYLKNTTELFQLVKVSIDMMYTDNVTNPYNLFNQIELFLNNVCNISITPILLQASNEVGLKFYTIKKFHNLIRITINVYRMICWISNVASRWRLSIDTISNIKYDVKFMGKKIIDIFDYVYYQLKCRSFNGRRYHTIFNTLYEFSLHHFTEPQTNISIDERIYPTGMMEFCMIMIKCGKCDIMCKCDRKIKDIEVLTHNARTLWELTGDDCNTLYAYISRDIYTNYNSFGKNFYIIPICKNKRKDIGDDCYGINTSRMYDLEFKIKFNFVHKNDTIYVIQHKSNVYVREGYLDGLAYST